MLNLCTLSLFSLSAAGGCAPVLLQELLVGFLLMQNLFSLSLLSLSAAGGSASVQVLLLIVFLQTPNLLKFAIQEVES